MYWLRFSCLALLCAACGDDAAPADSSSGGTDQTSVTGGTEATGGNDSSTAGVVTSNGGGMMGTGGNLIDPGTGGTGTAGTGSGTGGAGTTQTGTGSPPVIVSMVQTSMGPITENIGVDILVTASDPDGLDNLAGGSLVSLADAGYQKYPQVYVILTVTSVPGEYEGTLSWDDIDDAHGVEDFVELADLNLTVRIFDLDGNTVEEGFSVQLTCELESSCGGTCTNTTYDDDNCGHCGGVCGGTRRCSNSKCPESLLDVDHYTHDTCTKGCAALSETCMDGGECGADTYRATKDGEAYISSGAVSCDFDLLSDPVLATPDWSVRCCCTDGNG